MSGQATDMSLVTSLAIPQAADLMLDFKYAVRGSGENETAFDCGLTKLSSPKRFRISEADDPIGD
jgi:hypothetical protein